MINKKILVIILLFATIFFIRFYPSIIDSNYMLSYRDNVFHTTIVDRIQQHDFIDSAIDETSCINMNCYWSQEYVMNYPKMFHYATATLPFSATLSVNLMVSLLITLLFIGMFLLTYHLTRSIEKSISAITLFFIIDFIFNITNFGLLGFTAGYMFFFYAQLLLNVFFILFFFEFLCCLKERNWIAIILLCGFGFMVLAMTHNYSYSGNGGDWLSAVALTRLIVMLLTVAIPFFLKRYYHRIILYTTPVMIVWLIWVAINVTNVA